MLASTGKSWLMAFLMIVKPDTFTMVHTRGGCGKAES